MINVFIQNEFKTKDHNQHLNNKGKNVGGDFWSSKIPPKMIPRAEVRAFIYKCVYTDAKIRNVKRQNVNLVINQFNMQKKDGTKVKKMIENIIKRDNVNLPPISYENSDSNDDSSSDECTDLQLIKNDYKVLVQYNARTENNNTEKANLQLVKYECKESYNAGYPNKSNYHEIQLRMIKRRNSDMLYGKKMKLQICDIA